MPARRSARITSMEVTVARTTRKIAKRVRKTSTRPAARLKASAAAPQPRRVRQIGHNQLRPPIDRFPVPAVNQVVVDGHLMPGPTQAAYAITPHISGPAGD